MKFDPFAVAVWIASSRKGIVVIQGTTSLILIEFDNCASIDESLDCVVKVLPPYDSN